MVDLSIGGSDNPLRSRHWSLRLGAARVVILAGIAASAATPVKAPAQAASSAQVKAGSNLPNRSSVPASSPATADKLSPTCDSPADIVVCGQRAQAYRLDPDVMQAGREVTSDSRSASTSVPAAQATCSAQPMGCGKGLASLDLANVAMVVGEAAVTAAKGQDWTRALRRGGPDEYQLYVEAKKKREARDAERRAAAIRHAAREAARAKPDSE